MAWYIWGVVALATRGVADSTADLSTACATALQASLVCDPFLTYVMTSNYYTSVGNTTIQDEFCSTACSSDLASYRDDVATSCANDPQPFSGYPATYWADWAISAFDHVCMKDADTGEYCVDVIGGYFQNQTVESDGTNLPTDQLCSSCVVALFSLMQSTPYSNYDPTLANVWSNIQSQCSLSQPTAVPALDTNLTQPGGFALPRYSTSSALCLSGITYTVVSGDSCEALAENYGVSTGTLIAINDLYVDCTNLGIGQVLCIPPQCTTYNVENGDTCDAIANNTSTSFQQLVAWNPSLGSYCTNLLSGENICVSPPGGVQNLTTIAGATATQTGIYATTTASRPSPVATGTTLDCGKYYQVQAGDNCQLISLNQTISIVLLEEINPDIDSTCSNLELGVYYCILPTKDWNATVTSTIVTAPTTTPVGTTSDCYQYYVIQSGDYCSLIESEFDITMAQLQLWNPALLSNCSNLALGEAYCVNGAEQASPSIPATVSVTATAAAKEISHPRLLQCLKQWRVSRLVVCRMGGLGYRRRIWQGRMQRRRKM
ncbi:carbohydrate-binding module family 50 protein [Penicillium canescens]|uniref:carbohydrate-binding module family 50 protein n=1 Tax=Penicillium canescens TaxID=5083 RepID=UPI0026E08CF1|nr:carbohydrate-binding module family 50 protein [Penicillium canescens]KAJ6045686.1 carbohydrate-binding module family 50 protein [Penicillium canescens]